MTTDMDKLATTFWTEVGKVIAEEKPTARFEALVGASPLTPDDSAELRAAVDADRAAQRRAAIKPMTVAQLRAALDGMPDDAPVHVQSYVPYAGDDTKRGGLLVHAEGLQNEVTGIIVMLWSAERAPSDPEANHG